MKSESQLLVNHVRKHISLDEGEAALFTSLVETHTIHRKDFLLRQGEVCRFEYFVTKGCLRTYTLDETGVEHTLYFSPEEWWVGDLTSFLTDEPSIYNITALEETVISAISRSNLDVLYQKVPQFERFFRILIQNAFIAQQQRISQKLSLNGEQRYREFIEKYPQLEQRVSLKMIASYLGITPEFLSMIRRKMIQP